MKDSIYQVSKIMRRAGNVTRFHTHRMTFPDKINSHSYNASLLAYDIASRYNANVSEDKQVDPFKCSFYMLMHDVAEHIVGDVPGHIKVIDPAVKELFDGLEEEWHDATLPPHFNFTEKGDHNLNEVESMICHFCDKFEAFQTTYEELRYGNFSFKFIFNRMNKGIANLISGYVKVDNNLKFLWDIYSEFSTDVSNNLQPNVLEQIYGYK